MTHHEVQEWHLCLRPLLVSWMGKQHLQHQSYSMACFGASDDALTTLESL